MEVRLEVFVRNGKLVVQCPVETVREVVKLIGLEAGETEFPEIESKSNRLRDLRIIIKAIIGAVQEPRGAPLEKIVEVAKDCGYSVKEILAVINKLKESGDIYSPRYGYYKLVDL